MNPNDPLISISIYGGDKKLLAEIKQDGTVVVHEPGSEKRAAESFYKALEIEGVTLHGDIVGMKKAIREALIQLRVPGQHRVAQAINLLKPFDTPNEI
jgi:hypothetical protein